MKQGNNFDLKSMLFLVAAVVVGSFVYSKVAPMIGGEGFEMEDED